MLHGSGVCGDFPFSCLLVLTVIADISLANLYGMARKIGNIVQPNGPESRIIHFVLIPLPKFRRECGMVIKYYTEVEMS